MGAGMCQNDINNLTDRQKEIALIIAKSVDDGSITMSSVAEKLNISTRTVLREIGIVEEWFLENNFKFSRKTGTGISLDEPIETKKDIIKVLSNNYKLKYLSKEDRKLIILATLLNSSEPVKATYLTKILKISDSIITSDFLEIGNWLARFSITIIRKPGTGSYLFGNESDLRNVYMELIYENYDQQQLIDILKNIEDDDILEEKKLFKIIDIDILRSVDLILNKTRDKFKLDISDISHIETLLRLSVFTSRVASSNFMKDEDVIKLNSSYDENIVKIATSIYFDVKEDFNFPIIKNEINYICFYLKTLNNSKKEIKRSVLIDNIDVFKIANSLIKIVESELHIPISKDEAFFSDLIAHLEPAIYRIIAGISIKNPFIDEIKAEYSEVYSIIRVHIEKSLKFVTSNSILDDEIVYIVMHFIVSIERVLLSKYTINCVVSCPTGIGTSRLLSLKLKEKFKNLSIVGTISAFNINDDKLISEGVDLVISTVDLDTKIECICVNKIISFTDENLIKKKIIDIAKSKIVSENTKVKKKDIKRTSELIFLMEVGKHILTLKDNFVLFEPTDIRNIEDILNFSSRIYTDDKAKSRVLLEDLKKRIDVSIPYFEECDLFLLHCATYAIEHIGLSIIRTSEEILFDRDRNSYGKNIVFMSVPKVHSLAEHQLLSEISINLVNNDCLINAIKTGSEAEILENLQDVFVDFYERELLKLEHKNKGQY